MDDNPAARVSIETVGGGIRLYCIHGPLDTWSVESLPALHPEDKHSLMDFSDTGCIDSSGWRWLVLQFRHLAARGGRVVLVAVPPHHLRRLGVLGLDRLFECVATVEQGTRLLAEASAPVGDGG